MPMGCNDNVDGNQAALRKLEIERRHRMVAKKKITSTKERDGFDLMIGRLDRITSEMIGYSTNYELDAADKQTLKHHAEDFIGASRKVLSDLGFEVKPQHATRPNEKRAVKQYENADEKPCPNCGCNPCNVTNCH